MRLFLPALVLALLIPAAAAAAPVHRPVQSGPKIAAKLVETEIYQYASAEITGRVTDQNADLARVSVGWGQGEKQVWQARRGAKVRSVRLADFAELAQYSEPGEFTVTVRALDRRGHKSVQRLRLTVLEDDSDFECDLDAETNPECDWQVEIGDDPQPEPEIV
jgi:hypothetical protein